MPRRVADRRHESASNTPDGVLMFQEGHHPRSPARRESSRATGSDERGQQTKVIFRLYLGLHREYDFSEEKLQNSGVCT
jgi:hypothetical protein